MAKTLLEYMQHLAGRKDLLWPKAPPPVPVKATPYLKPLAGIKAVAWNVYGTLLRIADGELRFQPTQPLRIQVALEKTIQEFNMWNSMYRTPEKPWEYMHRQVEKIVEETRLRSRVAKGDAPETDAAEVWGTIVGQLREKEYAWDRELYGDEDDLALKIAWFHHAMSQGVAAAPEALAAVRTVAGSGRFVQALLGDGQPFTVPELQRAFAEQGEMPPLPQLLDGTCEVLSFREGCRKPSPTLWKKALERFARQGIEPAAIVCVGSRLADDLAVAKRFGLRTALYAGDQLGLRATAAELKDPATKPDRLLTALSQIRDILGMR